MYHVLLRREDSKSPWSIEFGDYDRSVVSAEREDLITGSEAVMPSNLRILSLNSTAQAHIDARVVELNRGTS